MLDFNTLYKELATAFQGGGWMMYPIAGLLVLIITIILERSFTLYLRASMSKKSFLAELQRLLVQGDLNKALAFCGTRKTPASNIVKAGVIAVMNGSDDIGVQAAMDQQALSELPSLEKRTGYLAMLGNIATLAGLLGTIIGLIHSFAAVSFADPAEKAALLSRGISEAMNCTAFGLLCAIPALLMFSLLQGKTQGLLDDINETTVSVLNMIVANRTKFK